MQITRLSEEREKETGSNNSDYVVNPKRSLKSDSSSKKNEKKAGEEPIKTSEVIHMSTVKIIVFPEVLEKERSMPSSPASLNQYTTRISHPITNKMDKNGIPAFVGAPTWPQPSC